MRKMNTAEMLDYLVEAFKRDSVQYADIETPRDTEGKRRLLRSLMNLRMPAPLDEKTLAVQNEYLSERLLERGVVKLSSIPANAEGISVWQGDITRLECEAIVNAANSQMLGCFVPMHACIDNCIHTYAGVQLRAECHRQMTALRAKYGPDYEQPTAVPMLTGGYNLPAARVIHIVGPIVGGSLTARHERELADCYKNVLDMCAQNGIESVAFCCISTGVFRFPNGRAAQIAAGTVRNWLAENPGRVRRVIFNVFKDEDRMLYEGLV